MINGNYFFGSRDLSQERVIVVTGVCRSGKTLLSRILGSCENIEWVEEPWALMMSLNAFGLDVLSADEEAKISWFQNLVHETFLDNILLRNGNFRPNDLSSVWKYKSAQNIFNRMTNLYSRSDAEKYMRERQSWILVDIPEEQQFIPFLRKCFRNAVIIQVVRRPDDVVKDVIDKGWMRDDVALSVTGNVFRKGINEKKYYWFVPEQYEDAWDKATEVERAMMYWTDINLYGTGFFEGKELSDREIDFQCDIRIRYEDMVHDIKLVLKKIEEIIPIRQTSETAKLLSELKEQESFVISGDVKLERRHLLGYERLKKIYGYSE